MLHCGIQCIDSMFGNSAHVVHHRGISGNIHLVHMLFIAYVRTVGHFECSLRSKVVELSIFVGGAHFWARKL